MKNTLLILVLILILGCSSKEDLLIGKWEKAEEHFGGNLGNKVVVNKVKNSKTYTFKKDNKLSLIADGLNYEGIFEVVQNEKDYILHTITFSQIGNQTFDSYFRIHFEDSITMKKISFVPIHPDNQVMYSVGRKDIYEKKD
ncbi:hypothetical protein [Flavobacterium sp. UBA7682]|uniref:hypothetical protein n=1 Tax=Flavobacterium sp. UBA7682 TaxID=1946560 RepID=UPI0025C150FB|nr:hypothetical protein [Flavobacterium sp. UBA7682]